MELVLDELTEGMGCAYGGMRLNVEELHRTSLTQVRVRWLDNIVVVVYL